MTPRRRQVHLPPLRDVIGRTDPPPGLRKLLGSPALFGIVQGFIAASVYFVLGLIAERAGAYTWLVFLAAAAFFVLLVLSYVEGASLHQERGGATVIARYGFNELVSFVAGWAILLDYVILVAVCAFMVTDYAAILFEPFDSGPPELILAGCVVLAVAALNVRGPGPRAFDRAALLVLADLAVQVVVVILGLALLLEPEVLTSPGSFGAAPSLEDFTFAFTLALVAFAGIDASSGLAGQVAIGRAGLRRLISARLIAAVGPLVAIGVLASSVLPAAGGERLLERPMLTLVEAFEQDWLREPLRWVVAIAAVSVLIAAAATAMLGLSRLGYALALNRQIPSLVGRLHPTRFTPVVIIGIGTVLALALIAPTDLEFLTGIYAFGATLAFTLVHASVVRLRYREPDRDRPYKMPFGVRVRGGELPVPAVIGALVSGGAFVAVLLQHGTARLVGAGWMLFGIGLYVVYRLSEDKSLLRRVTVPEQILTRTGEPAAQYSKILVPVLGTPLDDDIVQTAGRLAAEEEVDPDDPEGTVIEAIWVHRIPLSLPLDARVPDAEVERARAALQRAKAVGEEYSGVRVETHRVRGRSVGAAIVREAARKGVEAIVIAAERPTPVRGGLVLGGKAGLHDTFVGETTRYVIDKAPCRVILTAPPAEDGVEPADRLGHPPVPEARAAAPFAGPTS